MFFLVAVDMVVSFLQLYFFFFFSRDYTGVFVFPFRYAFWRNIIFFFFSSRLRTLIGSPDGI